jgi:hypothetical protein
MSAPSTTFPLLSAAIRPDARCPYCGRVTFIPAIHREDHYLCRGCLHAVRLDQAPPAPLTRGSQPWVRPTLGFAITVAALVLVLAMLEFAW